MYRYHHHFFTSILNLFQGFIEFGFLIRQSPADLSKISPFGSFRSAISMSDEILNTSDCR
jgi:hypothetical protein